MLRSPFTTPGYHTKLSCKEVHRIRESLMFGVALLDTTIADNYVVAARVFRKVLSLQDTDPSSATYGIWSWYLEEPLAKMSPPDWNWADFCGAQLLEALLTRRDRLEASLAADMDRAVIHAARSIERRNVKPDYTNISIMGAFVTLATAESYGLPDLHQYGMGRLGRFFDYTREQGAFSEYNSPNYTRVALNELLRLRRYVRDPEARKMVDELYDFAWKDIAIHFHAPSGQWAGPHSRSYQNFLPSGAAALFRDATGGRFPYVNDEPSLVDERHRMPHVCPPHLVHHFLELKEPRTLRSRFLRATPDLVGTTHLEGGYSLGTINYGDLWNQRRALLAYWGTPEAPAYLHLRFLHDGYDFSAAHLFSVQREGKALCGISFATDGGDTHVFLDPIRDGTIVAKDLRLRFDLGGIAPGIEIAAPTSLSEPFRLATGNIHLQFAAPVACWGEKCGYWESGRDGDRAWLDVVLYSGESRSFNLGELSEAALVVAVDISADFLPSEPVSAARTADNYQVEWAGLGLSFSAVPGTISDLRASFADQEITKAKSSSRQPVLL